MTEAMAGVVPRHFHLRDFIPCPGADGGTSSDHRRLCRCRLAALRRPRPWAITRVYTSFARTDNRCIFCEKPPLDMAAGRSFPGPSPFPRSHRVMLAKNNLFTGTTLV